jgi:hypothetical protein
VTIAPAVGESALDLDPGLNGEAPSTAESPTEPSATTRPRYRWAETTIVIAVITLASLPYLVQIVTPGVLGFNSGLATIPLGPWLGHNVGLPWVDPNVGYVSQALGHLSAVTLLHGHLPWWNPYEALGTPLAGEGQSASLFPLTLLMATTNGQIWFHFLLEITAGVATQRLLKEMGMARSITVVGGIVFGLNGTFAWITNAAFNPVAFLPVILWGIERGRNRSWREGISGWLLIAVGLALSIYAGFPETAYLNGLLALAWAVLRFFQSPAAKRIKFAITVALGGAIGVLVSSPFIVAFADATKHADIGGHAGTFANASFPTSAASTLGLPYLLGPIYGYASVDQTGQISQFWGSVGGYLTAAMIVTAIFGLVVGRDRGLKILLGVWMAVTLGKAFGVAPVVHLVNLIPGVSSISFNRYILSSWAMVAVILAALGLERISSASWPVPRWAKLGLVGSGVATLCVVALEVLPSRHLISSLSQQTGFSSYVIGALVWATVTVVMIVIVGLTTTPHVARLGIGIILIIDALAMFMVPQLSAPTSIPVNTGVTTYLHQHAGLSRYVTLGPISPNYGSFFTIYAANDHDLPLPRAWANYVHRHLETNERPQQFDGATRLNPNGPTALEEFTKHLASYELVGVRYLVTSSNFPKGVVPGQRVFHNHYDSVWKLPSATPFYYTVDGSCSLTHQTIDSVRASCPHSTTLIRSEMDLPGWSVTVNGVGQPLKHSGPLFMKVTLPAGTSELTFDYLPPHMKTGALLALFGLVLGVGAGVVGWRGRRTAAKRATRRRRGAHRIGAASRPPATS